LTSPTPAPPPNSGFRVRPLLRRLTAASTALFPNPRFFVVVQKVAQESSLFTLPRVCKHALNRYCFFHARVLFWCMGVALLVPDVVFLGRTELPFRFFFVLRVICPSILLTPTGASSTLCENPDLDPPPPPSLPHLWPRTPLNYLPASCPRYPCVQSSGWPQF